MPGYYLQAAARNFARSWTHTLISVSGLALGLAACLTILVYVRYELSYDHWLPSSRSVYQLQTKSTHRTGGEESISQFAAYPARAALAGDFPQIERIVYAGPGFAGMLHEGRRHVPRGLLMADGPFFDILAYPFEEGDPATALAKPGSVVLTRSEAERIFGAGPAMGEVLTFTGRDAVTSKEVAHAYRVTGIVRDLPKNTHLDFAMVARFDGANVPPYVSGAYGSDEKWGCACGYVYLKLRPGADAEAMAEAMPAWEQRHVPPDKGNPFERDWRVEGIRDIHVGDATGGRPLADRSFIATFAAVAFLILAMACINFANLSTARASRRAREVALRKLLGARRRQLVVQFVAEAMLFTGAATVIALSMVEMLLPFLSRFLDADLAISWDDFTASVLPITGLALLAGLASGLYPALYLSRFLPARVLKANASVSEAPGSERLRGILVVAQFAAAIGLIACTAVIHSQIAFARAADPGFRRNGLIVIGNFGALEEGRDAFAQEAALLPGVRSVGRSSVSLLWGAHIRFDLTEEGMTEPLQLQAGSVDADYFKTLGIRLLAGRSFDERRPTDDMTSPAEPDPVRQAELASRSANVVLNRRAVERLGLGSPEAAVGKTLRAMLAGGGKPATVIGVVENSRFGSVREPVEPTAFYFDRRDFWSLAVHFEESRAIEVRSRLQALWRRRDPHVPPDIAFADEMLRRLYEAEEARGRIFAAFAAVAVLIACLGLFGLAAFTAERRAKEIAIRKVLGARTRDIVRLLVWQFSKPVLAANLIAWPAAWWAMRSWLNGFDARIALGPAPFLGAGLLALAIALGTVAWQAARVARANPVVALRSE